jgi:hypothetical protein
MEDISDEICGYDEDTVIILEYAGLGDAIHTKLAIQHLTKMGMNVVWIAPDLIADLFKEDSHMSVFGNHIYSPLRNPSPTALNYHRIVEKSFLEIFDRFKFKYNVTAGICSGCVYRKRRNITQMYEPLYRSIKLLMDRDFSIQHQITHTGNIELNNSKPILCMETTSVSNYANHPVKYQLLIDSLSLYYDVVLVGGDRKLEYQNMFLDFRGSSLYDTFSVIKKSSIFIGRNSSNAALTVFKREMPVIMMDVVDAHLPQALGCRYWDNLRRIDCPTKIYQYCKELL